MKLISAFFILLFSIETQEPPKEIYGKWQLVKIEVNQETKVPDEERYFLRITEDVIYYNLEVNNCERRGFSLNNNRIKLGSGGCTKICCDGSVDLISNFINYEGEYELKQNQLIITTDSSKIFLERYNMVK